MVLSARGRGLALQRWRCLVMIAVEVKQQ
jgi:hypothetical protein